LRATARPFGCHGTFVAMGSWTGMRRATVIAMTPSVASAVTWTRVNSGAVKFSVL
jgi:hypothetical protein